MAYRASSSGGASYSDDDDSSPAGNGGGGGGGGSGGGTGDANHRNHGGNGSNNGGGSGGGGGGGGTPTTIAASDLRDKPLYLLEHLATFTVDKVAGIVLPADGIRRLLQLEKTTGIWSQKMQLCLDREWVLIVDFESGNIIERFPATAIMEPTAFTSSSSMDMYNNVLVFIVAGHPAAGSRSEMHIFQSQSTSAIQIVEDLKQLRSGQHQQQLPSSQRSSPKHYPASHHQQYDQQPHRKSTGSAISAFLPNYDQQQQATVVTDADASSELSLILGRNSDRSRSRSRLRPPPHQQHQHHPHHPHQHLQHLQHHHHDDVSSTSSSEKYERDVCVLNHCFDDIEKFIARLQHAAAASRELERRQHARKSSGSSSAAAAKKKHSLGDGLLTLRTKPPYEKEFADIFSKFKLSFNLLAKLKSHIHDPNAPELIHFLFTPLALIVDASHDAYYTPNISGRTVDPLLTREAVNLLCNCVTSKETELWRSLGETWTVPRDQWKGHVGSYHPVFFDGWSPDYPVIDDLDDEMVSLAPVRGSLLQQQQQQSHLLRRHQQHQQRQLQLQQQQQMQLQLQQHQPYQSEYEYDPKFVPTAATAAAAAAAGGGRDVSTTRSDLSSDSMVIMERNGAARSQTPVVVVVSAAMAQHWLDAVSARGGKLVQTTHPRTANNDKELTVMRGEYLEVLDDTRKWWKCGNARGQVGHVPHTIIIPWQLTDRETGASPGGGGNGGAQMIPNTKYAGRPGSGKR